LQQPATLFQSLVGFAPDALLVVDTEGRIVFANSMAAELFGFSREELTGSPLERLVPVGLRHAHARHRRDFQEHPRTREMGAAETPLRASRADGSEFPVEIRLSSIMVDGRPLFAAAVRDITEKSRTAEAMRAARDEAARANDTKGRFVAAASHDLRQPLQALHLLGGALRQQIEDPTALDLLGRQMEILDSMSRLVNALLDISKLDAGTMTPRVEDMDVGVLFEELRRQFESVAAARGLTFSAKTTLHLIHTDVTLFRELLDNLVSNAIKYTHAGSVAVTCRPGTSGLLITVTDTGIGIARDKLDCVFDEFYQIDHHARQSGAGLGLAIVKRIVALLGLSIAVESEPGHGSTFSIHVPASLVAEGLSAAPPPLRTERARVKSGALVLLVEDDDALRHATALYLKAVGYNTISASGVADAERKLLHSAQVPDVIVTDFHLGPDETGADLIQKIRARIGSMVPALLLSGDTSAGVLDLAETGKFRVLSKPVSAEVLDDTLSQLVSAALR
jgi:two-component system, sensor histidine kinase